MLRYGSFLKHGQMFSIPQTGYRFIKCGSAVSLKGLFSKICLAESGIIW
jgi:hypothetical protein